MPSKGTLIVILGPTGCGKTDLSVELAGRFDAPIISFDSRQVFKEMSIGTAQPDEDQLKAVKHYFIADRDITEDYNSGKFEKEALTLLGELFGKHSYVIAVGGSGLYIDALLYGFDDLPIADNKVRQELEKRIITDGIEGLAEQLRILDPVYYEKVDRNNPARLIRALEVCISSGHPYSSQRSGRKAQRDFNIVKIGITTPREQLYNRINRRVDKMLESGLEQEARKLHLLKGLNSLNTVGYKEMFEYFEGNIEMSEAVKLIKRNSRRYAKRQMTWFNRDKEIKWFDRKEVGEIENFIKKFAE